MGDESNGSGPKLVEASRVASVAPSSSARRSKSWTTSYAFCFKSFRLSLTHVLLSMQTPLNDSHMGDILGEQGIEGEGHGVHLILRFSSKEWDVKGTPL